MKCQNYFTKAAANMPPSECTSIPKLNARSVAPCSAGTAARTRTSTAVESMNLISCFARLVGMTFTANKAENLFAEIIGDSPLVGLSPIFV